MATFETDGSIIGGLTMLDDNTLYAVSSNDKVYRLDGNLNFYYFLDVDGEIKSASTVTSDHNVYIASTDQNLYSFNASGITNDDWPRAMGSEVTASVAVDGDGNLYIGTENGIFQAVSPTNESLWASNLGAAVYASACISIDNKLYIPISDGRIICYNLNTINPDSPMFEWLLPTGSGIVSSPALDADGNIYVGTLDGRLIKVQDNGNSASIVWEVVTGDSIIASPIIDGNGNVLVGSNDGFFYSISPEGTINWAIETGGKVRSTAAIGGNGNIYFGSDDYKLFAVDSTGTVQWNYYASSPISSPVLASGDKIYFGEENGLVVKLTENSNRTISRNQPMWGTFQGNNKRTGSQSDSNLGNKNSILIPTQFTLHQNYPNPFNPTTRINYNVPEDGNIQMVIYDLMGREVTTLLNQNQKAGSHHLLWNGQYNQGQNVGVGMYFCQLKGKNFTKTIKMLFLE
jgi:ligand-binding sensor domain-containing protein